MPVPRNLLAGDRPPEDKWRFWCSAEILETDLDMAKTILALVSLELAASSAKCRRQQSCLSDLQLQVEVVPAEMSAPSLLFASKWAPVDASSRVCTSFDGSRDTLAGVGSGLASKAARRHDQFQSGVCVISALNSDEVTLLMHACAANCFVCALVSNISVFSELVTSNGSSINEEPEIVAQALDIEIYLRGKQFPLQVPLVCLLLTRSLTTCMMRFRFQASLLQYYRVLYLAQVLGHRLLRSTWDFIFLSPFFWSVALLSLVTASHFFLTQVPVHEDFQDIFRWIFHVFVYGYLYDQAM